MKRLSELLFAFWILCAIIYFILFGCWVSKSWGMQPALENTDDVTTVLVAEVWDGGTLSFRTYRMWDRTHTTICYITIANLHGWTVTEVCLPATQDGRTKYGLH